MSLKQQLFEEMKASMKAGDKHTVGVLRLVNAAIKQAEIARRERGERDDLDDQSVLLVLTKMVKQRQDSIAQYEQAGRSDLAQIENDEIAIIERYLPAKLDRNQIQTQIQTAITSCGAKTIADMGKVMAVLKSTMAGHADMAEVSKLVKQALSH